MSAGSTPEVTVAVIPHERFGSARACLERLFEATPEPHHLIYIDANSPRDVSDLVCRESRRRGFRVVRTENYLACNTARNIALEHVETPYVVFVDNDVLVQPGWLDALVRCADETSAAAVAPLYCHGRPEGHRVHMAGGELALHEDSRGNVLRDRQRFPGRLLEDVRADLVRERTDAVELHCLLVRTDVLRALGGFDEQILSACNVDFCLALQQAGHRAYIEPASVVTYDPPPPIEASDRDYYRLRWSRRWNEQTMARYRQKWGLADDDPALASLSSWVEHHRREALFPRVPRRGRIGRLGRSVRHCRPVARLEGWVNQWRYSDREVSIPRA